MQTTGFVNSENINSSGTWSLGLLQMDFFYRDKPWYAGQFVRRIIPKIEISKGSTLFFSTLLNKQKSKLLSVLVRDVDKIFREITVNLPVQNNQIDFDFMESIISELQTEHIAELENYLLAAGLKDCNLTEKEQKVLFEYDKIEWGEFELGTLFERIKTTKLPFKAEDLPKQMTRECTLPCLTSSFRNQGLNYYVPKEGATVLRNVISIPSNSDVYRAYYQSNDFTVLSDAYAIQWIFNDVELLPSQYLFVVSCINKVTDLPIYSYKNKLGGWNVVKNKYIQLPIKNDKPDYEIMGTLISAIQKLVIKDVVVYTDSKIAVTKNVTKEK